MIMHAKLEQLEQRLTTQHHRDLFLQTKHTLKAIDDLEEEHRKLTAIQALNGAKVVGSEETVFYATLHQVRKRIIDTLELTLEDLEHKGDKHYNRHFKDGVE